jgi:hypothetical protein
MALPSFEIPTSAQIYAWAGHLIRLVAIIVVAWITTGLIQRWVPHIRVRIVRHMVGQRGGADAELEKRAATLGGIFRKTVAVVIWILANMTHGYSYYVFDIGVAYKEDTDHVIAVVKGIAEEMMKEDAYRSLILEPLVVLGVDRFADSAVIVKARFKTAPVQQWTVGREMNRRIKKKFDELGIEIPFPHTSIYFGEASKPFQVQSHEPDREQMKALIRETMQEERSRAA